MIENARLESIQARQRPVRRQMEDGAGLSFEELASHEF